ncbi:hypothetical protein [Pseudidiomarina aestuarii]|uniref:primase 1D-like protein n=1 Tax=Pseudidiomarina aestuarii TaxID=624146 RepID=UPI003A970A23
MQNNSAFVRPNLNKHPIVWVDDFLRKSLAYGAIDHSFQMEFSRYRYAPQTLEDSRTEFRLPIDSFRESLIIEYLANLHSTEELALHSKITGFGVELHIPMVDFGYKGEDPSKSDVLQSFCKYWRMDLAIYSSGRSYHGYGNRLLGKQEWVKFMGSLLLLNIPGKNKFIDERWIGHRLLGGYASLRWSNNTSQYKKYPTFCSQILILK